MSITDAVPENMFSVTRPCIRVKERCSCNHAHVVLLESATQHPGGAVVWESIHATRVSRGHERSLHGDWGDAELVRKVAVIARRGGGCSGRSAPYQGSMRYLRRSCSFTTHPRRLAKSAVLAQLSGKFVLQCQTDILCVCPLMMDTSDLICWPAQMPPNFTVTPPEEHK